MRLGSFDFDPTAPSLSREGRKVEVPSRALEVLRVLAECENRVVDKRVIFDRVWPDGFVEENNLWQQIHLLRKALAPDPRVLIENVPRRGYRLVVPREAGRRRLPVAIVVALCGLVLLAATGIYALMHRGDRTLRGPALDAYRRGLYHLARREPSDLRQARDYFDTTIALAPDAPDGYGARAVLEIVAAERTVDRRAAGRSYEASYADENAAFRRGVHPYAYLARAARESVDPALRAAAVDDYRHALELAPNDANVASWYGFDELSHGDPAGAQRQEARASEADPSAPIPLKLEGIAAYYARDYPTAMAVFRNALAVDPSDDEIRYYRGLVEQAQAHAAAARADFRAAIAMHRGIETNARLALADLDVAAGHGDAARGELARLVRPVSGFGREAVDAAAIWMALGKPARALAVLRRIDPRDAFARAAAAYDPRLASLPFRTPSR